MSKWLATIFDDDLYDAKYRIAKSIIEKESDKIILRSIKYPNNGYVEWIISGDSITINKAKRSGITSETIYISHISNLKLKISGDMGTLDLDGNVPKLWCKGIVFGIADIFVAHAAAAYMVSLRQNDMSTPLQADIDPVAVEMRQQLDSGELDEQTMNIFRERGMLDSIGFVAPDINAASASETPVPQSLPVQSVADEISKLKALLDDGILTQEEFDHKKKSLLGM